MIKTRTGILLIVVLTSIIGCLKDRSDQISVIPNGDFENWTSSPRLTDWTTNSCPECMPPWETYVVQKDSQGYHGHYGARFIYNDFFPSFAENKFSLSFHPSALVGYFKCKMNGTDTVSVKIWLYKNRLAVDSCSWLNLANIPYYKRMRIPISQSTLQIDTVIIRITGRHSQGNLPANTVFWADYLDLE